MSEKTNELAILAGGCFWCIEAVFLDVAGVSAAQSGYIGGQLDAPSYERVCDGDTGHAEAVRIEFDPAVIGYSDLLDIFFAIHDPTTPNRQGNDVGPQYRSGIYYTTEAQKDEAEALIRELSQSQAFGAPVVTEVLPAANYWPAEDYHQDYFLHHPNQGYCAFVVAPKVQKFRQTFQALVRD